MKVDGTKNGIKTIISIPTTSPVKEMPVIQRRERIVDIAALDLPDDIENLRLQLARYRNENMDLQLQLKQKKLHETERYNRMYLYWKMLYEVMPDISHRVAKEFGVDLKRREYGFAVEDFDALFQAVCKTMFANDISVHEVNQSIDKAQAQVKDEQLRREYAERELDKEKSEKEQFRKLFESEKMKNNQRDESIRAKIGSFSGNMTLPAQSVRKLIEKEEELPTVEECAGFDSEETTQVEESFEMLEDIQGLLEQAEEDVVVSVLKEKGCEIYPADNPKHSYLVEIDNKKVPLRYFDYTLVDSKVFDDIMRDTNEIYLVFDNKENWSKGNTQWTRWLLFSQRKKNIRFSMTTIEDIRQKGLAKIG